MLRCVLFVFVFVFLAECGQPSTEGKNGDKEIKDGQA